MKTHHVMLSIGFVLVCIAGIKFAVIGFYPDEVLPFGSVGAVGFGALAVGTRLRDREDRAQGGGTPQAGRAGGGHTSAAGTYAIALGPLRTSLPEREIVEVLSDACSFFGCGLEPVAPGEYRVKGTNTLIVVVREQAAGVRVVRCRAASWNGDSFAQTFSSRVLQRLRARDAAAFLDA